MASGEERISITINNSNQTISIHCEVGLQGLQILEALLQDVARRFEAVIRQKGVGTFVDDASELEDAQ